MKPTRKQIWTIAYPILISLLMENMIGLTDTAFLGRVGEVELGASALGSVYYLVIFMLGFGFGIGAQILIARRNGEKAYARIGPLFQQGLLFLLSLAAVMFVISHTFTPMVLRSLISSDEVYEAAVSYTTWRVFGFFFAFVAIMFRAFFVGITNTKTLTLNSIVMVLSNVVLNYVLVFGKLGLPAMGVAGAAWATVIGQFCGMAVGIGINHVKNHEVRLNFRRFRPDWHSIKGIYQVGLPSIIMQSIGSVMTFGMNKILIAFTETAVSVFGVYFKLQSFVFMPVFGVTNALVPIVGYNYGARSSQRIQQATRLSLLMTTAIMALGTVIFQVAPGPLLSLFSASDTMLSIGIPALRIISVSFCFAGVAIVFSSVFQALGDGMLSLVMSAVRQLLLLLPCAFVLAKLGGLDAVWFSFLIAEVASVTLAVVFYRSLYNKKIRHI